MTLLTTTVVGAGLAASFEAGTPIDFERDLHGYVRMWGDPSFLLAGLPFSLTLLGILLAHEFGHFLAARYYRIDATLPFFLPAPTLIGTLGAFIRIRSMIPTKRILFDIGIAGPLEQILFGPAFTEDGTLNLVGAIRTCMGSVGARNIRELQQTELIIAPTIKTEGKVFQQAQKLGRPR